MNESRKHFTYIDNETIRFGLKAIKGLGDVPIEAIRKAVKEGKFTSIQDFIERTGGAVINKKSLESLIFSGALDAFGERASLIASIPKMTTYLKEIEKKDKTSQMGLFDLDYAPQIEFELEKSEPMTFEERMKGEKTMIGYPVSGHPLDGMHDFILSKSKNIAKVQSWFEKLHNPEAVTEEDLEKISENSENSEKSDENSQENNQENIDNSKNQKKNSKNSPDKKKKDEENATLMGLVSEVRHIPTKT